EPLRLLRGRFFGGLTLHLGLLGILCLAWPDPQARRDHRMIYPRRPKPVASLRAHACTVEHVKCASTRRARRRLKHQIGSGQDTIMVTMQCWPRPTRPAHSLTEHRHYWPPDPGRLRAQTDRSASTPEKRAFLTAYGAHAVLEPQGFREPVKALTDGRGADVIYDPVGGDVFDESVRAIAFDGRLLVIGFTSGRIATISSNMPLIKGFSVIGVRAGEYGRQFPERGRENLEAIWSMLAARRLRPHVHATMPLAQAREALALLQDRKVIGKAVIAP
ncbi:MAG: hypothetical protein EBZ50_11795, partial [Alphaproteobacteria bacterium]|nr:hypothetical protein [Alphaproteobacteria bacterium]